MDSHTVMDTVENICSMQDIPMNIKNFSDGRDQYTLIHNLGKKWSMIQKYVLESVFAETGTKISKFTINCDHISFTVHH